MEDIITEDTDIFESGTSPIFKDEYILTIEYIPKKLIGRSKQVKKVAELINPIFRRGKPYNCLLYGKTGSGKSVVAKFVLNRLLEKLTDNNFDHNLKWIYISCKQNSTTNDILYNIIINIDDSYEIPRKGFSLSIYYSAVWELMNKHNTSIILVLDEIDYMKSDELLYNFSRAGELNNIDERHFITVMGISNNLNYADTLDPRVHSSINFSHIIFEPYDAEQIGAILQDRVPLAFNVQVITDELVNICAVKCARSNGDARKAINLLRTAGNIADKRKDISISEEHLVEAEKIIAKNRLLMFATDLPLHNKLLLVAISKLSSVNYYTITSSSATKIYCQLCNEIKEAPLHRTTIASMISEFEMLGFLKTSTNNKGRAGGVVRYINYTDNVQLDLLNEVLYADYNLDELKHFKIKTYLL